jgi:hypothetical protein
MAITDATEFSTFDNDGDTNGSGVITADTFNEWRKKTNGIINKLVEVDNATSSSYQMALMTVSSSAVGAAVNTEPAITTIESDINGILSLDTVGNDFSLDTGVYELDVNLILRPYGYGTSPVGTNDIYTASNLALYNIDTAADVLINSNSVITEIVLNNQFVHLSLNLRGVFTVSNAAHDYVLQFDAVQDRLLARSDINGYITLRKLS